LLRRVFGDRRGRVAAPTRPLRQRLRLPLMLAGPAVVILGALWWYLTSGRYVETDDAYIQAARTMISADVAGRVMSVEVHDNERVTKGQVLYRLDPASYQAAVNDAKAQLGMARLQVEALKATYQQKIADNKGRAGNPRLQPARIRPAEEAARLGGRLAAAIRPGFERARSRAPAGCLDPARYRQCAGPAGRQSGHPVNEHPMVQRAQAVLDERQIDLKDTVIRAPENGTVTKVEQLQVGELRHRGDAGLLDDVGPVVGRGQFQGNRAHLHASRPGRDGRGRHLS
jgi:membrane fusion protein (multidrug efflux system)